MAQIKLKRGLSSNITSLALEVGEPAYTTDTNKLYVGGETGNIIINPDINVPVTSVAGKIGAVTLTKGDIGLGNVDNTSDVNKPISTAVQNALNSKADTSSLGTAAKKNTGITNGSVPILGTNGKLDPSVIPKIAISDTFVVNSQADMLALTEAELGDIAIRTDLSKTFILKAEPYSTLSNWQEMLTPTSPVTSVAGKTGSVTLTKSDVGLDNVDNTADSSKSVSKASTLTTARTISVSGAVTGSVSFNGSANVTIATTLGDVVIDGGTF